MDSCYEVHFVVIVAGMIKLTCSLLLFHGVRSVSKVAALREISLQQSYFTTEHPLAALTLAGGGDHRDGGWSDTLLCLHFQGC